MVQKRSMWPLSVLLVSGLVLSVILGQQGTAPNSDITPVIEKTSSFNLKTPLYFEANKGHLADDVSHMATGRGYRIAFSGADALIQLSNQKTKANASIHMSFAGANDIQLTGKDIKKGVVHRYLGKDKNRHFTHIPTYNKLVAKKLYPGISLEYYGKQRELEYDFIVEPGANPDNIRISFSGVENIYTNDSGDLVLDTGNGKLLQKAPFTYQIVDGIKKPVESSFKLDPNNKFQVAFNVDEYDRNNTLVIDPAITYSSYLGTASDEWGTGIAVDSSGNIYVALESTTRSPPNTFYGITVKKFSPAGVELYSSEIFNDATGVSIGAGIAVSDSGLASIAGYTNTSGDPLAVTANAYKTTGDGVGFYEGFVVSLDTAGLISYASYLGGNFDDNPRGIDTDGTNLYITGTTLSTNFPVTADAYDSDCGNTGAALGCIDTDQPDIFISVIDPAAADGPSSLVYSTYFGGTGLEKVNAIDLSPAGLIAIGGKTESADFPVVNPFAATRSGSMDGIIAVFDHTLAGAAGLLYSTHIGSTSTGLNENLSGVVHDGTFLYVTGYTDGTDFPTAGNAFSTTYNANLDVFVSKLDPSQSGAAQLVYSTYLGGNSVDTPPVDGYPNSGWGNPIGVYKSGADDMVVIGGSTPSTDWPVTADAEQAALAANDDSYIAIINTSVAAPTSSLVYSSYYGSAGNDYIADVFVQANGTTFFTGNTTSTALYVSPDATQPVSGGGEEAFIVKLSQASAGADASVSLGASSNPVAPGTPFNYVLTVSNAGPDAADVTLDLSVVSDMTINGAGITIDGLPPTTECSSTATTVQCIWSTATTGQLTAGATHNVVIPTTSGTTSGPATAVVSTGITTDPDSSNNTASYDITVSPSADLAMQITPITTSVNVGTPAVYELTVNNPDITNIPTGSTFTMPVPANSTFDAASSDASCSGTSTITCAVGAIASSSVSGFIQVAFIPDSNAVGSLSLTATVNSIYYDPNLGDNTVTDSTVTVNAITTDLRLTSLTPSATAPNVGDTVTYTAVIDNISLPAVDATGVVLTNVIPAGTSFDPTTSSAGCTEAPLGTVTCDVGSIAAGFGTSVNIGLKTHAGAVGVLGNTVSVTSTEADSNLTNNSNSDATVTVNAVANINVTIAPASANPVAANSNTVIPVNVNNSGPNTATGITVSHALVAGTSFDAANSSPGCSVVVPNVTCTIASVAAGTSGTVNISIIPSNANAPSITPVFSASAAEVDTNLADNTNSTTITVNTAPAIVDLSMNMGTITPAPVLVGQSVLFPVTISNAGPDAASSVKITLALVNASLDTANSSAGCFESAGAVECPVGTVAVGATPVVNIALIPNAAAVPQLDVTFVVGSADTDSNTANNIVTSSVPVNPVADLSISQVAPLSAGINSTATYTLTVINHGPSPASGIIINDALNTGGTTAAISSGVVNSGNPADVCTSITATDMDCSIASLAAGASVSIDITVDTTGATSNNTIINQASIKALTETDTNTANDISTASTALYDSICSEPKTRSFGLFTRNTADCVVGASTASITGGGGASGIEWLFGCLMLYGLRRKYVIRH